MEYSILGVGISAGSGRTGCRVRYTADADRLAASLGIVKMDEYLVTGTRKQFWKEHFVSGVIQVSAVYSVDKAIAYRSKYSRNWGLLYNNLHFKM